MLCANMEGTSLKGCNFEDPAGTRANMEGRFSVQCFVHYRKIGHFFTSMSNEYFCCVFPCILNHTCHWLHNTSVHADEV